MSNADLSRYVVTFHYQESGLSDIPALTSTMIAAGFTTTLADDDGHPYELGTNSYGIVSALEAEALRQQVAVVGENALGQKPDVTVTTFEKYLRDTAHHRPAPSVPE